MFYGSNLNYSAKDDKYELKYNKRKYLLKNLKEFKGLYDDAKKLFKYFTKYIKSLKIIDEKYELEEEIYIDKYELNDGKKEEKKINSIVCEIYFYLESKILLLQMNFLGDLKKVHLFKIYFFIRLYLHSKVRHYFL